MKRLILEIRGIICLMKANGTEALRTGVLLIHHYVDHPKPPTSYMRKAQLRRVPSARTVALFSNHRWSQPAPRWFYFFFEPGRGGGGGGGGGG